MTESGGGDPARRRVLYSPTGTERVQVERDLPFPGSGGAVLRLDLYRPPALPAGARCPVVLLPERVPDDGFERVVGCRFKEMGSVVSWATLIAAAGMAAVACSPRNPSADAEALVDYLQGAAPALSLNGARIGLWASSGHVPLALWLLSRTRETGAPLTCAALCYGYTADLAGHTAVADAALLYRFSNPGAGMAARDLLPNEPLLIVRAGRDEMPGLNACLDAFVSAALARNLPVTLHNVPSAPHAFDLTSDTPATRRAIALVLEFLRRSLSAE